MTEKRVDLLMKAMQSAFEGRNVKPIIGFWTNDDGQTMVDFSLDISVEVVTQKAFRRFMADTETALRFCEALNKKNIVEEQVDEAIADEKKVVGMLAKAIKTEDFETIYDFIEW